MTVQEFFNTWQGRGCDFDGAYGFQCMDLAEMYNRDVVGAPRIGGNAIDAWNNASHDFYTRIPNTPTGVPQAGDIVIWSQGVGQFGHIAIADVGNTVNFTSMDQNWPLGSVSHFQQHNYNNVLGWLHPKQSSPSASMSASSSPSVSPSVPPEPPSIPSLPPIPPINQTNWFLRFLDWLYKILFNF